MQSLEPRAPATGSLIEDHSPGAKMLEPAASQTRPFQKMAVSYPATEAKPQAENEAETANAFDDAARAMTEALNETADSTPKRHTLEEEARVKHRYYLNIALDSMMVAIRERTRLQRRLIMLGGLRLCPTRTLTTSSFTLILIYSRTNGKI